MEKQETKGLGLIENDLKAVEYAAQLCDRVTTREQINKALDNARRHLAITLGTFNTELDRLIGLVSKLANCTDDDHEVVESYAVVLIDFIEQLRDEVAGEKIEG